MPQYPPPAACLARDWPGGLVGAAQAWLGLAVSWARQALRSYAARPPRPPVAGSLDSDPSFICLDSPRSHTCLSSGCSARSSGGRWPGLVIGWILKQSGGWRQWRRAAGPASVPGGPGGATPSSLSLSLGLGTAPCLQPWPSGRVCTALAPTLQGQGPVWLWGWGMRPLFLNSAGFPSSLALRGTVTLGAPPEGQAVCREPSSLCVTLSTVSPSLH